MLVTVDELEAFLKSPVDEEQGEAAIRVAVGWLQTATRLPDWPFPVPDDIWSWAVELAAIAYDNPTSLSSQNVGDVGSVWAGQQAARREAILLEAASAYGGGRAPSFAFPAPEPWPSS